jgi:hypothetical protein
MLQVPYNVPRNGLDLVTRFLGGQDLGNLTLPNYPLEFGHATPNYQLRNGDDTFRGMTGFLVLMLMVNAMVAVVAFLVGGLAGSHWVRRKGYEPVASI